MTGATGAGGEIGHIHIVDDEPDACGCGNHGCLEQYASATGVVRLANRKLNACSDNSVLRDAKEKGKLGGKQIFDAAKAGDKVACAIVDEFCMYLGKGLAMIAGVVNPEAFVLGGGVSKAGEILREACRNNTRNMCSMAVAMHSLSLQSLEMTQEFMEQQN